MSEPFQICIKAWNDQLFTIIKEFSVNNHSTKVYLDLFNLLSQLPPLEISHRIINNNSFDIVNGAVNVLSESFSFQYGSNCKDLARLIQDDGEKTEFILITQCLMGYWHYHNKQYTDAFDCFRWCLKLISYLEENQQRRRKRRKRLLKHKLLSPNLTILNEVELFCSVHCSYCLIQDGKINNNFQWLKVRNNNGCTMDETIISEGSLFGIMKAFDPDRINYEIYHIQRHKSTEILETLTDLLYHMAVLNSETREYVTKKVGNKYKVGLWVNDQSLAEIIEKYIIVIASKLKGDPSVVRSLVKLIKCIILYGGIKYKVLQFFYVLYLYYTNNLHKKYQPRQIILENQCLSFADDLNKFMINNSDILPSQQTKFLPQFLIINKTKKLVMVDQIQRKTSRRKVIGPQKSTHRLQLKLVEKWNKHISSSRKVSESNTYTGDTWVENWKNIYFEKPEGDIDNSVIKIYEDFWMVF